MSNKYILKMMVIDQIPEIEIDKKRFEKLKMAGQILSNALSIEQLYAIIVSNFLELERESVNIAISSMVYEDVKYKDFFDIQSALNVKVANLLTVIHLYRDQLLIRVPVCVPFNESTKSDIEKSFSQEYDAAFEYKFMYALRNHAQHHGVPVHSTFINLRLVRSEDGCDKKLLEHSVFCYATKKELELNEKFKKEVLNEMPKEINLLAAARVYVESMSRIHEQVREKIKKNVESARSDMDNAISEYKDAYKKDPVGLYALEYQGERETGKVSIMTEGDDIRQELVRRNRKIVGLGRSYVSSRADK